MTVEILQSDSPEEVEKKLQAFWDYRRHKEDEERKRKRAEMKKYFGILKLAEDPVVMQRKWRDEW